jgi:hypothetical protein
MTTAIEKILKFKKGLADEEARREQAREDLEGWNLREVQEREDFERRHLREVQNAEIGFISKTGAAPAVMYADWLKGYLDNGGEMTHSYDYPISRAQVIYISSGSARITPLYGSSAKMIIVPKGVEVTIEALGHNNVFFMSDFSTEGYFVPLYPDIEKLIAAELKQQQI